jgi:hypothetical protein
MPANRPTTPAPTLIAGHVDGIILAPIERASPWAALGDLRSAMTELRDRGLAPRVAYVFAVGRDGRIVPGRHRAAAIFVLGYRLRGPQPGRPQGWAGAGKLMPPTA